MAKLVVSCEGVVQGHYFLDKDQFVIGRKPDNDIFLDDPSISKSQAIIVTIGNDHILEDAGSTNGTTVNGMKVVKHILQNNDVIEISAFQLKYVNQRATADMDFDKTLMMAAPWRDVEPPAGMVEMHTHSQLATALSAARTNKASFPLGGVKGVKGQHMGQEIVISRPLQTFGQAGDRLAVITRRPHGYYVTHVEGKKHPKVNGKSIGTQPYQLHENDLIEVADEKLIFFLKA